MTVNLQALVAARQVVERVLRNIGESLARGTRSPTYGARGETGEVEFDRSGDLRRLRPPALGAAP